MNRRVIALLSFCFLLLSCKNYYVNQERGNRPKRNNFTLNKQVADADNQPQIWLQMILNNASKRKD